MSNADFPPDLHPLAADYQILTELTDLNELNESADARTYLARHLQLNRDVTITVHVANSDAEQRALSRFEADVARLRTLRHPNVIPVIEGRRLDARQFAVVRARVRGSSLDQLVGAAGTIPQQRVADMLDQIRSALDWARAHGISDRHVSDDTVIVQQGSGRVLLSFELAAGTDGLPSDACDDARTIGSLAWQMLSGERFEAARLKSLDEMRPDLSRAVVAETNALAHCWHGGPVRDVSAYLAMLRASDTTAPAAAAVPEAAKAVPATAAPIAAAAVAAASAARVRPPNPAPRSVPSVVSGGRGAVSPAAAVVPVKHGWGFGARFAMGAAAIAVLVLVVFVFMQRDSGPRAGRTALAADSKHGQAGGDVGTRSRTDSAMQRVSTAPLATTPAAPPPLATTPLAPPQSAPVGAPSGVTPIPQHAASDSAATASGARLTPPVTRRHEPPRTTPPVVLPAPAAPSPATDSAPADRDACDVPTESDQHRCLMRAIDENDVALNAVYSRLVSAFTVRARANSDRPSSDAIEHLRSVERDWVDMRDRNCHPVGSGSLYARERAQCFASESERRTGELSRMLDSLNSTRPDSTSDRRRMMNR